MDSTDHRSPPSGPGAGTQAHRVRPKKPILDLTATEASTDRASETAVPVNPAVVSEPTADPLAGATASAAADDAGAGAATDAGAFPTSSEAPAAGATTGEPLRDAVRRPRASLETPNRTARRWPGAVLGGIAGALTGAAATAGVLYGLGLLPQHGPRPAEQAQRLARAEEQLRELGGRPGGAPEAAVKELAARIAVAEQAARPIRDVQAQVAQLSQQVEALQTRLTQADEQRASAEAQAPRAGERLGQFAERLDKLQAQLDETAASAAAAPPAVDLSPRLTGLENAAQAATTAVSELRGQLASREAAAQAAASGIAELRARVSELADEARQAKEAGAQSATALGQTVAKTQSAMEALDRRLQSAETARSALETQIRELAGRTGDLRARRAAATLALRAAAEQGEPFAAELDLVKALGAEPTQAAPLETFARTGLPNASALTHELRTQIAELQPPPETPSGDGGILDRLQQSASKLVRLQRAEGASASSGGAADGLTRLAAAADRSDLVAAIAEAEKLPPDLRARLQPWTDKVRARAAALQAARTLSDNSLRALTETPSEPPRK